MPQASAPGPLQMMFPFVMMFVIFYFLVFRPQTKARKTHDQMLKNLKKDDEVVTSGGIFGTVVNMKPDVITLRIDEKVRVDVERSAVTRLVKSRGADADVVAAMEKRS